MSDALQSPADSPHVALRDPAHKVSPRAKSYWRLQATITAAFQLAGLGAGFWFWPDRPWWGTALIALLAILAIGRVFVMPPVRYAIHRWEVSPIAVYTRSGWLSRHQQIVPLSRVQTVDSHQAALMRPFNLMTVTVTTASALGSVRIECLDAETAKHLVAELTEITAATEGDAT
ncbi:MAG: PH domain-containing protein [Nocardioides sp.]|jgi:membrane protein YdbS with pleckstrin-like domain